MENTETLSEPEKTEDPDIAAQVFDLVRGIPYGQAISYGAIGARCEPPISGYICGRIMGNVPDDAPWWRVVAKSGSLPIYKRNPHLAVQQRQLLESEGVKFSEKNEVLAEFLAS